MYLFGHKFKPSFATAVYLLPSSTLTNFKCFVAPTIASGLDRTKCALNFERLSYFYRIPKNSTYKVAKVKRCGLAKHGCNSTARPGMNWDEYADWGKKISDWGAAYHQSMRDPPSGRRWRPVRPQSCLSHRRLKPAKIWRLYWKILNVW